MCNLDLVLINPPIRYEKPDYFVEGPPAKGDMKPLNPGLLSIASYLDAMGYAIKIVDLALDADFQRLRKELQADTPCLVGISSTCAADYLETLKCAQIARQECPESLIVAGGQHIGPLAKIALDECAALDVIVKYEGEHVAGELIRRRKKKSGLAGIPGIAYRDGEGIREDNRYPPLIDLNEMPFMNFRLYPAYLKFIPHIEESRGCPYSCGYCTNSHMFRGRIRVKRYDRFAAELDHVISYFGKEVPYAVMASTFGVQVDNTLKLAAEIAKRNVRWTTEFRVDSKWDEYLTALCESGFWFCNIGFESGSPEILQRMGKTQDPMRYLERARLLARKISGTPNLKLRFNYMTYIGESPQTLADSLNFLLSIGECLDVVLANNLCIYPGSLVATKFAEAASQFGSALVASEYAEKRHAYQCQVSRYFSFQETAYLCDTIEKIFTKSEFYEAQHAGRDYREYEKQMRELTAA